MSLIRLLLIVCVRAVRVRTVLRNYAAQTNYRCSDIVVRSRVLEISSFMDLSVLRSTVLISAEEVDRNVTTRGHLIELGERIRRTTRRTERERGLNNVSVNVGISILITLRGRDSFLRQDVADALTSAVRNRLRLTNAVRCALRNVYHDRARVIIAINESTYVLSTVGIVRRVLSLNAVLVQRTVTNNIEGIGCNDAYLSSDLCRTDRVLVIDATDILDMRLRVLGVLLNVLSDDRNALSSFLTIKVRLVFSVTVTNASAYVGSLVLDVLRHLNDAISVLFRHANRHASNEPYCDFKGLCCKVRIAQT